MALDDTDSVVQLTDARTDGRT